MEAQRTFAERSVELFLTSRDGRRVVVEVSDPSYPPVYHLVDFDCSSATMLGCVRRQYGEDSDTWPYRKEQLGPVTDPALALDAAGKSYRYVRLPGEDHWLSSSETRIQVLTELESFLESSLHSACSISEQK